MEISAEQTKGRDDTDETPTVSETIATEKRGKK